MRKVFTGVLGIGLFLAAAAARADIFEEAIDGLGPNDAAVGFVADASLTTCATLRVVEVAFAEGHTRKGSGIFRMLVECGTMAGTVTRRVRKIAPFEVLEDCHRFVADRAIATVGDPPTFLVVGHCPTE